MNSVKKSSILAKLGIIIILTFVLIIDMSNNLINTHKENINNFSMINRVDMHPLDSLRFKFF